MGQLKEPDRTVRKGYLIDWEASDRINDAGEALHRGRAGTWTFMSIRMLNIDQINGKHTLADDMEALLYVVLHCALYYLPHDLSPRGLTTFIEGFFDHYLPHIDGGLHGGGGKFSNAHDRFFTRNVQFQDPVFDEWLQTVMDYHCQPMDAIERREENLWTLDHLDAYWRHFLETHDLKRDNRQEHKRLLDFWSPSPSSSLTTSAMTTKRHIDELDLIEHPEDARVRGFERVQEEGTDSQLNTCGGGGLRFVTAVLGVTSREVSSSSPCESLLVCWFNAAIVTVEEERIAIALTGACISIVAIHRQDTSSTRPIVFRIVSEALVYGTQMSFSGLNGRNYCFICITALPVLGCEWQEVLLKRSVTGWRKAAMERLILVMQYMHFYGGVGEVMAKYLHVTAQNPTSRSYTSDMTDEPARSLLLTGSLPRPWLKEWQARHLSLKTEPDRGASMPQRLLDIFAYGKGRLHRLGRVPAEDFGHGPRREAHHTRFVAALLGSEMDDVQILGERGSANLDSGRLTTTLDSRITTQSSLHRDLETSLLTILSLGLDVLAITWRCAQGTWLCYRRPSLHGM
ncbi:hypothetical protein NUW54_g8716 [Trametes sanguinea]|uniref:Uncharacterized protein n=1 Tax=Trametes sanguinea TaxID=158606 RepID=A0ACC1PEE8_9APHY|nr:hypothetical protein NUW54_g8716 [Trametes sanguinea]